MNMATREWKGAKWFTDRQRFFPLLANGIKLKCSIPVLHLQSHRRTILLLPEYEVRHLRTLFPTPLNMDAF